MSKSLWNNVIGNISYSNSIVNRYAHGSIIRIFVGESFRTEYLYYFFLDTLPGKQRECGDLRFTREYV